VRTGKKLERGLGIEKGVRRAKEGRSIAKHRSKSPRGGMRKSEKRRGVTELDALDGGERIDEFEGKAQEIDDGEKSGIPKEQGLDRRNAIRSGSNWV